MKINKAAAKHIQSLIKFFKTLVFASVAALVTQASSAVDAQESRLNQVEKEILEIDSWFAKKEKLKQNWSAELKKADLEVQRLKRKILVTNKNLDSSNDLLKELKGKKSILEKKRLELANSLSKHLRSTYKLKKSSPLKKLLEGESIDKFDQMMRYNRYLTNATNEVIKAYRESLEEIEDSDNLAQTTKEQILKSIGQNEESLLTLSQTIIKRKMLISEVEAQQKNKTLEYNNLVAERETLEELIAGLLTENSTQNIESFLGAKNSLPNPLRGKIHRKFGEKKENGTLPSQGLDILAPVGTPVHAVSPGQIVFSDWLRGFGLLIIIDHGNEYMSLYGNTEAIYKTQGDLVESGELIAEAGNSGGRKQPGIYFEIRHRGQPIDPEPWIQTQ